ESVDLQLRVAVAAHTRHFGRRPPGVWLPECAYRPRYEWTPPAGPLRGRRRFHRLGLEEHLAAFALEFFVTDVHLARGGAPLSAYRDYYPALRALSEAPQPGLPGDRSPYCPYRVASRGGRGEAVAFVRDPATTMQVWSRDAGYPGDPWYLEFHKKHFPGGLRYWRVTSPRSDLGAKEPYVPARAAERVRAHAEHFVGLLREVLSGAAAHLRTPVVACSPYDTELFGHWWFEGPRWLEEVFTRLPDSGIMPVDCATFLADHPPAETLALQEGSWGEGGDHRVWLNRDTEWTWERLYGVEEEFWSAAREAAGRDGAATRVLAQAARELLLLQASDWQFLITTWAARDYAEARFTTHYTNLTRLLPVLRRALAGTPPSSADEEFLRSCETQNFVFPDVARHVQAALERVGGA
ncbi:MAG TPA: 1,4-alpha-glucan branching protein domain-containing protein, partial [bacterium]|nr:1,4-alpha-glucan branching protein domain-containing protein [bacterium]